MEELKPQNRRERLVAKHAKVEALEDAARTEDYDEIDESLEDARRDIVEELESKDE